MIDVIPKRLEALSKNSFRTRFHLREKELKILQNNGLATIRQHAFDIVSKRLAPAIILNDGKQTPFTGHPVFVAQHATATCCRKCLEKWHKIPKERELTKREVEYILSLIEIWIVKQA